MYLQGVLRLVIVCFLAAEIRTVQAERIVSLAPDAKEMASISNERRRSWFSSEFNRWKRRLRKRTKRIHRCKRGCVLTSIRCLKGYAGCLASCVGWCYAQNSF